MTVAPGEVEDAVFYGTDDPGASWSTLLTDLSGEATDMSLATGSGIQELTSTRVNLVTTRTVDWRGDITDTDTGTVFRWTRSGTYSEITVDGAGAIDVTWDGGTTTESYTVVNMPTSPTTEEIVITWAMEPNPDTTGASDAQRSELHVYNADQSTYELHTWTHAVEVADATGDLFFGVVNAFGGSQLSADTFAVRLSSAFHSSDETYQTFVSHSSAPSLVGEDLKPSKVPQRGDVSIGDDGHMAGPVLILGAKAAQQHRMLLAGPIVNEQANDDDPITTDTPSVGAREWGLVTSRGDSMRMEWLFHRPVHPAATHVSPTIYVQNDPGISSADLVVYCYSMNAPGPDTRPPSSPEQFIPYWSYDTRSADDGTTSTGGAWLTLDKVRISRDNSGWSFFVIGLEIDYGVSSEARIKAFCLDPVVVYEEGSMGVGGFG